MSRSIPYKCPHCDMTFKYFRTLRFHRNHCSQRPGAGVVWDG